MTTNSKIPDASTIAADTGAVQPPVARPLSPAAERALKEAAERRAQRESEAADTAKELGGRAGPDPVRYGDWENGGIASDF